MGLRFEHAGLWGPDGQGPSWRVRRVSGWPIRAGIAAGLLVLVVPAAALAVVFTAVLLGAGLAGLLVWSVCQALHVGWQRLRGPVDDDPSVPLQGDGRINVRVVQR